MAGTSAVAGGRALRAALEVPDREPDWTGLRELPAFAALDGCPQDPRHHGEGDVGAHTRMVVDRLRDSAGWRWLAPQPRGVLQAAALLHDAGKPLVLRHQDGVPATPGHAAAGAHLARLLLWEQGVDPIRRERICDLVARHMALHHLYKRPEVDRRRTAGLIGLLPDQAELEILVEADVRGRIAPDIDEMLLRVALSLQFVREVMEKGFASEAGRLAFFDEPLRPTGLALPEPAGSRVWLLSGLPGAGKDHWARTHRPNAAVVSLDALRRRDGIRRGDRRGQGRVISEARAQLREHLAARREVVVNAMHLTRRSRAATLRIAVDYDAHVTAVRVEAGRDVIQQRNAARPDPERVPAAVLNHMAGRWEPPGLDEVHRIIVEAG